MREPRLKGGRVELNATGGSTFWRKLRAFYTTIVFTLIAAFALQPTQNTSAAPQATPAATAPALAAKRVDNSPNPQIAGLLVKLATAEASARFQALGLARVLGRLAVTRMRTARSLHLRRISSPRFRIALNRNFRVKTRVDWCRSLYKSVPIVQLWQSSRTPILDALSCVSLR